MILYPVYYNPYLQNYTFINDGDIDVEAAQSINSSIAVCRQTLDLIFSIESATSVKHYTLYTEEQLLQTYAGELVMRIVSNTGDSSVHRSRITHTISQEFPSYEYTSYYTYLFAENLPRNELSVEPSLNRTYAIAPDTPSYYGVISLEQPPKLDRRISNSMIDTAIRDKEVCPISLEPIRKETAACVSPCYHCFDRESIEQWLLQSDKCPQCRIKCVI